MKKIFWVIFLLQAAGAGMSAQEVPFHKGVQFTNWFQEQDAHHVQFTKYTKKDFEQVRSLGCDVVRLPINLHFMTGGAPDYRIDTLFYYFLDQVVDWSEDLGMYLILDNHTFDPSGNTSPDIGEVLNKVWQQMAAHYRNRSSLIMYEVLNEPHGISDELWNGIQEGVIRTIRQEDTVHAIIVGPAGWNSYRHLDSLPAYEDDHLIYTFHFYDPFLFTHQGATWTNPSMQNLAHVPFPYAADSMPSLPDDLKGTWVESAYNNYNHTGTESYVRQELDIAVAFQQSRQVPLYCGEFGVYMKNSKNTDRVRWYGIVRQYLEAHGIPWTMWDYHGGFGLFVKGGNDMFEHDLNIPLLEALGFNVPEQTPYVRKADSTGFMIYTDHIAPGVYSLSYGTGQYDLYSRAYPNNGVFCLKWEEAVQYNALSFDFRPDKDLSRLRQEGYALDLIVRSGIPGHKFDLRFLDTKTEDPGDHPWRMNYTLDEQKFPADGRWHHLHIPLTAFVEGGAWDNGWYEPEGKFDWTEIDQFQIVNEYDIFNGNGSLFFDNIHVTNQDTARVYVIPVFAPPGEPVTGDPDVIRIFPNPVRDYLFIESTRGGALTFRLMDVYGQVLLRSSFRDKTEVCLSGLKRGLYFVKVEGEDNLNLVKRIMKI